jgi:hypothetical protein
MAITDRLTTLRRTRAFYRGQLTLLTKKMDEYEESNSPENVDLAHYGKRLNDIWTKFETTQLEIEQLDEEEHTLGIEISEQCDDLTMRISHHLKRERQASISKPTNDEAGIGGEPTPIKLPEIQSSNFDGTLVNWHSFHNSFSSAIDRNERLTTQKFQYLLSSVTGKAAISIQSLDVTETNYPIAINLLKERFDCHRKVCMRHWDLIVEYPQITTEVWRHVSRGQKEIMLSFCLGVSRPLEHT